MKRFFIWTGCLFLPLVLLILIGFMSWEPVSFYVLKKAVRFFAAGENIALDVNRIQGRLFSEITLDNLSMRPVKGQPQTFYFTTRSITCSYNLWDLKEGPGLFMQGLKCSADDPGLAYDARSVSGQDKPQFKPTKLSVPAILPELDVHNGTVILTHFLGVVEIKGIVSSLRAAADGAHELHLQVNNFKFNQDGDTKIDTGFTSLLTYAGAKIIIDSFEVVEKEISAAGFIDLLQIDKGITGFALDLALASNRLQIAGSKEDKILEIHAGTDSFDIGELQKRLGGSGWKIHGKIRGKIDYAHNFEAQKESRGSFGVDVQNGQMHDVPFDSVSVAGSFTNDVSNISIAEARTPGNHILVKDFSVPLPLLLKTVAHRTRSAIGTTPPGRP